MRALADLVTGLLWVALFVVLSYRMDRLDASLASLRARLVVPDETLPQP